MRALDLAGDVLVVERRVPALARAGEQRLVTLPEGAVDVARVALELVDLRHEGDRHAVLVRDFLGSQLVEGVVVGHPQRLLIAEVDLVLAEVALALRVFQLQTRRLHRQADRTNHVLDHRRAEDRVVDVVRVGRLEVAVSLVARRIVRLAEQDELELRSNLCVPAAFGKALKLRTQDLARRLDHGRTVVVHDVGDAEHGALKPRHRPQRRKVRLQHEVPVARLPARQGEPRQRHHLHVDREQVVAGLRTVCGDAADEGLSVEALALQTTLHVCHRQDDRVDLSARYTLTQLIQRHRLSRLDHTTLPRVERATLVARVEEALVDETLAILCRYFDIGGRQEEDLLGDALNRTVERVRHARAEIDQTTRQIGLGRLQVDDHGYTVLEAVGDLLGIVVRARCDHVDPHSIRRTARRRRTQDVCFFVARRAATTRSPRCGLLVREGLVEVARGLAMTPPIDPTHAAALRGTFGLLMHRGHVVVEAFILCETEVHERSVPNASARHARSILPRVTVVCRMCQEGRSQHAPT